ncbi:hypothetical protein V2G26_021018 [Clonostachys chloroleuca]
MEKRCHMADYLFYDPTDHKYDHPSTKRKTKANRDKMRRAERNVDMIWGLHGPEGHFRPESGIDLHDEVFPTVCSIPAHQTSAFMPSHEDCVRPGDLLLILYLTALGMSYSQYLTSLAAYVISIKMDVCCSCYELYR